MAHRSTRREFAIGLAGAALARAAGSGQDHVNVVSLPAGGIQPQIAVSGGVVHLIYYTGDSHHGDLFYARSDNFGRTFSPALRVNSQPGSAIAAGAIRGAQISLGKDNRVHVAWNGSDAAEPRGMINPESGKPGSPMLYARFSADGTTFEPQRNLMQQTFGLDGGGTIAASRDGAVYIAWHGKARDAAAGEAGRRVWIARSRDEGRTFAREAPATQDPTGACACCGMRLFVDSRGEVYGLYRSARENVHRDIYLLRSSDRGATFSAGLLHPWNINACPMSSMALLESNGELWGAWETQTQIYFAPLSRGLEAARRDIAHPPGDNPKRKYPALARNARGETLLAWVEGAGWQRAGTLGWQIFDPDGRPTQACDAQRQLPVWSFPAAFARPDGAFTLLV